jgi:hypothetical protein
VRQAFNNYKTAILNDDPQKALNAVDSRTKKYYSEILHNVKSADSSAISNLPLIDKLTILVLRAKATKEEILEMKENDAFIFAIKKGMVGKDGVANNTIGHVIIDSNFAKAEFIAEGKETSYFFHFYKEEGEWKLDITSLFPLSNLAFKQMIDESKKDENTFLFEILNAISERKISSDIWNPVL